MTTMQHDQERRAKIHEYVSASLPMRQAGDAYGDALVRLEAAKQKYYAAGGSIGSGQRHTKLWKQLVARFEQDAGIAHRTLVDACSAQAKQGFVP